MKTISILIAFFALLLFSYSASAQEPVKGKTAKTEVKDGKDTKDPKAKTNAKDNKGSNKSAAAGEPIPGSEILLEQEPDNKTAPKDNNHEDDMMLEDDK